MTYLKTWMKRNNKTQPQTASELGMSLSAIEKIANGRMKLRKVVIGALDLNGTLQRFNNIRVGEVLQYNRPLTATEVSSNYNATKSNYGL